MNNSKSMRKFYESNEHYFGDNGSICVKCGHSISECREPALKCISVKEQGAAE